MDYHYCSNGHKIRSYPCVLCSMCRPGDPRCFNIKPVEENNRDEALEIVSEMMDEVEFTDEMARKSVEKEEFREKIKTGLREKFENRYEYKK